MVAIVIGLLIAGASVAHAVITSRLVVLLGVTLTPAQAKAAYAKEAQLGKHGITLVTDPSMTEGNTPVAVTVYAGRVLSSTTLTRNRPSSALAPLPTADQIDKLRKELEAQGLPDDVQVISVVVYSGGK